jgi:hypothetical protein
MLLKMLLKSVQIHFKKEVIQRLAGKSLSDLATWKRSNCAAWINTIVKCGEMYSVCLQYRHQYCKYIYRGIDSCVKIQVIVSHTFVFNKFVCN